jgi:predicted RNA-binding Zn-ribbon protein involved in translation (DUF1610 family)
MGAIKAHLETLSVLLGSSGQITPHVTEFGSELWALVEAHGLKLEVADNRFANLYSCPKCGESWEDEWSCACNDECPQCGTKDIEPVESELLEPVHVDITGPYASCRDELTELVEKYELILKPHGNGLRFVEFPDDSLDTPEEIAAEEDRRDHKRGLYGDE